MKTSVIEVRDMLSVLSVLGVEERIGEVPGVDSVTVNFSAGSATVRYDETRLDVADIKAGVRQRSYEADAEPNEPAVSTGEGHARKAAPALPESAASKTPAVAPAAASAGSAGAAAQDKVALSNQAPDAAAAVPVEGAGHEQHDKAAPAKA